MSIERALKDIISEAVSEAIREAVPEVIREVVRDATRKAVEEREPKGRHAETREPSSPPAPEEVPAVMSPQQLAGVLSVSVRTLSRWREIGEGPVFQHPAGSKVYRYYRRDLIAWLENQAPATRV